MKLIRSNYRDGEQFMLYIINEDKDYYSVQLIEQYRSEFQEGDSITKLRKKLVGDEDNLYSIIEVDYVQVSLF